MRLVEECDVLVVGAGFGGLYALYLLRQEGFHVKGVERASGVGGTWFWNRYPGARCDVESLQYSYSFDDELQQEWEWSERYAAQPEILEYAEHVADRFDLSSLIAFDTNVEAATFNEDSGRWRVETSQGVYEAQFLVAATGCLSTTNLPKFDGLSNFTGDVLHTGQWPHEPVDFTGQRVGIIGTGSSAVQAIPVIAAQAAHLSVFQRTPNYSVPARNEPLDPRVQTATKQNYEALRQAAQEERSGILSVFPPNEDSAKDADPLEFKNRMDERWEEGGFGFYRAYADIGIDPTSNERVAEYVRSQIVDLVDDAATAQLLAPTNTIACKRPCLDTGYYETFNLPHVELVDISSEGIEAITSDGVRAAGRDFEFDVLILATGFDAMTGALLNMNITGKGGSTLSNAWSAGPRNYLGLSIPEFPNLFTVTGPGSPSVLTNMIMAIEQHVEWIRDCLVALRQKGIKTIEASPQAADSWVDHVNRIANQTLYPTCNSWYLGANIPGKTRVFMPLIGYPPYAERCQQVADNNYEGFALA
ncbi:MAG: cyclohexanone monooxygenase [Acidimicrobiaceae bacterium]|nr:cyclohexanone monooxygenase [Acidimicrobiaceae bacterium]|tara:strand:+ start:40881 stop:42476 length:1596 start_codon:yes stop_codon:yes gene_type:complete